MTYSTFTADIERMNQVYELPVIVVVGDMKDRLPKFYSILKEECEEIEDIGSFVGNIDNDLGREDKIAAKVAMADLLGDIIVYCASEAVRWGIPLSDVLQIIMASNFSKLDADGKPIKDERGKFLKGPNYWKPEPLITAVLAGELTVAGEGASCTFLDKEFNTLFAEEAITATQVKESRSQP